MSNIEPTLEGLRVINLKVFKDERGFFTERFVKDRFAQLGLTQEFVQDNHSRSKPGVIRGLHFQHSPGQGKLVGVIRGRIWDVAVDVRPKSKTFGKWFGTELSDENGLMMWIPSGFAHGFCVLGNEDADVLYKVDVPYAPQKEIGIHYADPDLKIDWPIKASIVGAKDMQLASFAAYAKTVI